jgi:hypothetical protein
MARRLSSVLRSTFAVTRGPETFREAHARESTSGAMKPFVQIVH